MAKADAAEHTAVDDIAMAATGQMRGQLHLRTFGDTIQYQAYTFMTSFDK